MIKKIIAGVLVLAIVVLAGYKLFFSTDKSAKAIEKIGSDLTSYHTEATMKIYNNDDKRTFFVMVDYLKSGESDCFRVSLLDENINQEQIMLRNKQGVYVLTPLLNQVYEFKGEYPLNSQKPYLYHSIMEAVKGEYSLEKISDGYLITFKPVYENSPNWVKEDIKLSKELKPIWINIYDSNNALACEVTFSKVEFNPSYEENFFDVESNMKTSRDNTKSSSQLAKEEDLPLLPTSSSIKAELKEQTSGTVGGKTVYILSYGGTKPFTIVQELSSPSQTIKQETVTGKMVDLLVGIGYISGNNLSYTYNGVNYNIYSSTLTVTEMVEIANSMDVVVAK